MEKYEPDEASQVELGSSIKGGCYILNIDEYS